MEDYNETKGRQVIATYNTAIDNLLSSKDPSKVMPEIGKVIAAGLDKEVENITYLGAIAADDSFGDLAQAVALYDLDRNAGLRALSEASQKVHNKIVNGYVGCYIKQKGIKPKWNEQENLAKAVSDIYQKWIQPEKKERNNKK